MPHRHPLLVVGLGALAAGTVLTAATHESLQQPPAGQPPPSIQGAELKGRAPVSDDVLQVELPRAREADLANGLHLIVLEDRRVPVVSIQMQIEGAGGYYDPADAPALLRPRQRCCAKARPAAPRGRLPRASRPWPRS
ncbi:MAG: hypothetical protein H0V80_08170 [Acidobacteria bacterium]|nr:hypothetical protein [Acidobacteriota bacterium]